MPVPVPCRVTVSTHSRPKAAAVDIAGRHSGVKFQHTAARRRLLFATNGYQMGLLFQHTAARRRLHVHPGSLPFLGRVSTHSRPKAAAIVTILFLARSVFQHTAARRRLPCWIICKKRYKKFQHTAARRRLRVGHDGQLPPVGVSTHSRPKAAAPCLKTL